jgi:hypothetical protein
MPRTEVQEIITSKGGPSMAFQVRPPVAATIVPTTPVASKHWGVRITLTALAAFLALTAIDGAIFLVPTIPVDWLKQGPFTDFTIPALALGILCGGSALVAAGATLVRPRIGALAAIVAGAMIVGFELVEIAVVGFTAAESPSQPVAWLQVFYLLLGTVVALLAHVSGRRKPAPIVGSGPSERLILTGCGALSIEMGRRILCLSIWLEVVAVLLRILLEECLASSRAEVQCANALVIHRRTQGVLCRALVHKHTADRITGHIGIIHSRIFGVWV